MVPAFVGAREAALRQALETAGVEFIEENGGGLGVRFGTRSSIRQKTKTLRSIAEWQGRDHAYTRNATLDHFHRVTGFIVQNEAKLLWNSEC